MSPLPAVQTSHFKTQLAAFKTSLEGLKSKDVKTIALGVQVGGSGTRLVLRSHDTNGNNNENIPVTQLKLETKSPDEIRDLFIAVAHAKQMFINLAKDLGQTVLPIIDSICGFPLSAKSPNPDITNKTRRENGKSYELGEHFLANLNRGPTTSRTEALSKNVIMPAGSVYDEDENNRVVNFLNLTKSAASSIQGLAFNISYRDDINHQAKPIGDSEVNPTITINQSVTNDTVLVASSAASHIDENSHNRFTVKPGENVVGLVCGTGFNIGFCKNREEGNGFTEVENTEIGHTKDTIDSYLTPLDPTGTKALSLEKLLASSKDGEGIRGRFNRLAEQMTNPSDLSQKSINTLNQALKNTGLNQHNCDPLTVNNVTIGVRAIQELIVEQVRQGKPPSYRDAFTAALKLQSHNPAELLARAFTALQFDQITQVLSTGNTGKIMRDDKTTRLALTGSWIVNLIDSLPNGKTIFLDVLNKKLNRKTPLTTEQLVLFKDKDCDGMNNALDNSLIQARAAMARLAV